jgi:DNA-directed RNA polymerase subunit RPC12/RpoP
MGVLEEIKKEIEPLLVLDDVLYCKDCGSRNIKKSYKPYKIGENIMKILDKYNNQQEFKWKCDICGAGFNNFHAQGFDNKIYCPLCYFKHEFNQYKKAWKELEENFQLEQLESSILKESHKQYKKRYEFISVVLKGIKELKEKYKLEQ